MIDILATLPDKEYISLFTGDWFIFAIGIGLAWAIKDGFNFNLSGREDSEEDLWMR
tara:strand:- start:617 stop:784 length:168 start_codon:yes stop_codon:yes gene_type:complete